jgi:hypothetical protein
LLLPLPVVLPIVKVPPGTRTISPGVPPLIVYVALSVALGVQPSLKALAFIVVVLLTLIGLLYAVELEVGSLPLVVYLIVAPVVVQLSVTFWVDV